jgi:hypothetical protein
MTITQSQIDALDNQIAAIKLMHPGCDLFWFVSHDSITGRTNAWHNDATEIAKLLVGTVPGVSLLAWGR